MADGDTHDEHDQLLRAYARRRLWGTSAITAIIAFVIVLLASFVALVGSVVIAVVSSDLTRGGAALRVFVRLAVNVSASADIVMPSLVASLLALAVLNIGGTAGNVISSPAQAVGTLAGAWALVCILVLTFPPSVTAEGRGEHAVTAIVLAIVAIALASLIRELLPFNAAQRRRRLRKSLESTREEIRGSTSWLLARHALERKADGAGSAVPHGVDVWIVVGWLITLLLISVGLVVLTGAIAVVALPIVFAFLAVMVFAVATTPPGASARGTHWIGAVMPIAIGASALAAVGSTGSDPMAAPFICLSICLVVLLLLAWLPGFAWWRLWTTWMLPHVAMRLHIDQLEKRRKTLKKLNQVADKVGPTSI